MAREKIHDVIVNMDIMLGVPSKSIEEAYDKVESFSTEKLLSIALEQLPFHEQNVARYVNEMPTSIN
jgi:coproporphyrinogen III oxidase-like Fe-S oxidoreductase